MTNEEKVQYVQDELNIQKLIQESLPNQTQQETPVNN